MHTTPETRETTTPVPDEGAVGTGDDGTVGAAAMDVDVGAAAMDGVVDAAATDVGEMLAGGNVNVTDAMSQNCWGTRGCESKPSLTGHVWATHLSKRLCARQFARTLRADTVDRRVSEDGTKKKRRFLSVGGRAGGRHTCYRCR